jgi:hypothetical protein
VFIAQASIRRVGSVQQAPRVGRRTEQVRRFLPSLIVFRGDEHRVAALGGDLDRRSVVVDLFDQGNSRLRASLAVIATFASLLGRPERQYWIWYDRRAG